MDASTASAIANWLLVLLTGYAIYVAKMGLSTWKEQKGFERELVACRRLEESLRVMRGQLHMLFASVEIARSSLGHVAKRGSTVQAQAEFVKSETERLTANVESVVFDYRAAIGEVYAVWGNNFFNSWADSALRMINIASSVRESGVLSVAMSHDLGPSDTKSAKARALKLLEELADEGTEMDHGNLSEIADNLKSMEGYVRDKLQKIHESKFTVESGKEK